MNIWKWIVLFGGMLISYFSYHSLFEQAGFVFRYFENLPDLRYMAVALYILLGNAIVAIIIVPVFAIIIRNRESLVAGLLALLPFLNNLAAYLEHNINYSSGDIMLATATGLRTISMPFFFMYSYRLVSWASQLLMSQVSSQPLVTETQQNENPN